MSLPVRAAAPSWHRATAVAQRVQSGLVERSRIGGLIDDARAANAARRDGERGQGLVEFALVFPIFMLLLMATIEFGLAFNAVLDVNYASRNAALLAAEAGNSAGADCVVLQSIEQDIGTPAAAKAVTSVDIYWADPDGGQKSGKVNHYVRSGSTSCTYQDGSTLTVPYTATTLGYVDTTRCNALKGCGSSHPGLDTIGVSIAYTHVWRTPMAAIIPGVGPGSSISFVKSNAMRMEPIL